MNARPLVLAMTGASGAIYSVRLLQLLLANERSVHLVISPSAAAVIGQELNIQLMLNDKRQVGPQLLSAAPNGHSSPLEHSAAAARERDARLHAQALTAVESGLLQFHHYQDYFTPIASGSHLTQAMIVCPCSGSTLSGIVRSASGNLIERAAEVHLKERRQLIVVPRETPLSSFQLENMLRASQAGIVVLPAAPGWYHGVHGLADLVDFIVARILDQLQIPHQLMQRWAE